MDKTKQLLLVFLLISSGLMGCVAQGVDTDLQKEKKDSDQTYSSKKGDPNGIGKWYMGREIAHVMGFQGINWLERSEREKEEQTSLLIRNMDIESTDVLADLGAGSGYHVFKMAPLAKEGMVYAVDIQQEMLDAMESVKKDQAITNIQLIQGEEQTSNLPLHKIDKILLVDVYHEFSYPKEMLQSMHASLKENGTIFLIEYRMEDPQVPIKTIHKMTETQARKEFEANGFELVENVDNLPWQHCMIFRKK